MTIRNFSDYLTKHQLQKGEDYFRRKKVRSLSGDDFGRWTAKVQGRELYDVQISIRNGQIHKVSCDCIAHTENEYCKHVVAVFFAIQQKEGLLKTGDELKAIVKKMTAEEMRQFIIEQANNNSNLQGKLNDWTAEEEEEKNDDVEPSEMAKTVKSLYGKMCKAVAIRDFAQAKTMAEQAMQQAKEKGNQKDYEHIQFSILKALQPSTDIMGFRELARRFYKESRDMRFYRKLKATYISTEWQKVATAHISRLEKNIPSYIEGTANPAELADVYLEEYEYGDALLKLLQQIPRLSFLNEYAGYLDSDSDGKILLIYRDALLDFARQNKSGKNTRDFLKGLKQMAELKGGKKAIKELTEEIRSLNTTLFERIPGEFKYSTDKGHSLFTTLALARSEFLIEKGKTSLATQQFQDALNIALAIVAVVPPPVTGRDADDRETEAILYINRGFALLLDISNAPLPPLMQKVLYLNALKAAPEPQYVLNDYTPHWIEVLLALRKGKEEQVLAILDQLLKREEEKLTEEKSELTWSRAIVRLLHIRIVLLKDLGRGGEIYQMIVEYPKMDDLREFFINEAETTGNAAMAIQLAEEGMLIHKREDRDRYIAYRNNCFELAQKHSDTARLRQLAREFYDETRDMKYYLLIKNTYSEKDWSAFVETSFIKNLEKIVAKDKYNKNEAAHELAAIYSEEQYYDRLLSVLQRAKRFNLTVKYTEVLCTRFPAAMLELYYEALAEFAINNQEAEAIDFIVAVMKLMNQWEGGSQVVKKLVTEFKAKYSTRAKLMEALGKL